MPFAQSEHSSGPAADLYLPASHSVQTPFAPVHPALQTHAVTAVLPCNEIWFNGQSTQAKVPGVDLYLPGAHIRHGPPLEPVDPELQIHCVMTVLPAGEVDCNGQAVQATDIPYDPARQLHGIIELIHQFAVKPAATVRASEVNVTLIKRCVVVVE